MTNTLKAPFAWTILLLALLSAGFSRAQIEVELALDQTVYIVGEPIRADISIVNRVLDREKSKRRSGPVAEGVLRDIGSVASGSV